MVLGLVNFRKKPSTPQFILHHAHSAVLFLGYMKAPIPPPPAPHATPPAIPDHL